jgi:hypothetical protein
MSTTMFYRSFRSHPLCVSGRGIVGKAPINFFLTFLTLVIVGSASEYTDFTKAQKADTIAAYESFLKQYPQGALCDTALSRLAALKFPGVQQTNTLEAYRAFVLAFPNTLSATEAKMRMGLLEYKEAEKVNTPAAYQAYLDRYPIGDMSSEARRRLKLLEAKRDPMDYKSAEKRNAPTSFTQPQFKFEYVLSRDTITISRVYVPEAGLRSGVGSGVRHELIAPGIERLTVPATETINLRFNRDGSISSEIPSELHPPLRPSARVPDAPPRRIECALKIPTTIDGITVTGIGANALGLGLWGVKLRSVTIPSTVTNIESGAFRYCISLEDIMVDKLNLSFLSENGVLFSKRQHAIIRYPPAKSGSTYTIPDSVSVIAECAFSHATNLTAVTIGNSVTDIGNAAFQLCYGLTNVTIPKSVSRIGRGAFSSCGHNLLSIMVDESNAAYSSVDGVLFNKKQNILIQCPSGKSGAYSVPGVVTEIGAQAFSGCTNLVRIAVPPGVVRIDDCAFINCERLREIQFEGRAPTIGSNLFSFAREATVYYTTNQGGWGETFAGRPTAVWKR